MLKLSKIQIQTVSSLKERQGSKEMITLLIFDDNPGSTALDYAVAPREIEMEKNAIRNIRSSNFLSVFHIYVLKS